MDGFTVKGRVSVRHPETGETWWVPQEQAQQAVDQGLELEPWQAYQARQTAALYDQPAAAAAAGVLRTLSLGLSDVAMEAAQPGRAAALKEHNPAASFGGEVAGALVPIGPAGLAGRAGGALAARLASAAGGGATAAKLAAAAARGVAEGAALGGAQGVSTIALQPAEQTAQEAAAEIAHKAVVGAVTGGLFSLVGLGLGGLGAKVAGRAQGPAGVRMAELSKVRKVLEADAKALREVADAKLQDAIAGTQTMRARIDAARSLGDELGETAAQRGLQSAEAAVAREAQRLGFAGGRGSQSGVPVHELGERLERVRGAFAQAQSEAFGLGGLGGAINRLGAGGLGGAALGFSAGGLAAGGVGLLVGQVALPFAGRALARVLSNQTAVRALGATFGAVGQAVRTGAVNALTRDEAQQVRERAAELDPPAIAQAAAAAYSAEGLDGETAAALADFQGRRAAALQQLAASEPDPRLLGQGLEAIRDPRGVVLRMARDESTPQDRALLAIVSPGLHRQLVEAARLALEEDREWKLPAARRRTLEAWSASPVVAQHMQMMGRLWAEQRDIEEQQGRSIRSRQGMLPHGSQLQAMEAGGGPGLRS